MSEEHVSKEKRRWRVSRRGFLVGLGATAGVLVLGVKFGVPAARLGVAEMLDGAAAPFGVDGSPTSWFEINADNQIILNMPKVEMGQGIHTTLGQIAAEELEIDWQQLRVQQSSTLTGPADSGGTGASNSTSGLYTPLREAAATMREMLRSEAARQLNVSVADLTIAAGVVSQKSAPENSLTYGEIVQKKSDTWEVPETAPVLKAKEDFKYIGKSQPRVDLMDSPSTQDFPLAQTLTPREQDVLTCIADGLSNRQIAEHLTIAMSTVKWYVRQIYNKLSVDSRAEAITRAKRLGLVSESEPESMLRHNLPTAATPFVGREQELAMLAKLVADPQVRIITILGPGGIGKTRLALELASQEVGKQTEFTDGIFFVSLAPLATAVEIIPTLAATLDFHFHSVGNEKEQLFN